MIQWWKNLSVTKKLYGVVGVMALLVASELLTLLFVMDVLSSVRSFVGGEGLWSKAQKDAVHNLHQYAYSRDRKHYNQFERNLKISLGDRQARLALESKPINYKKAYDGFVMGGNHPEDVPGLINLIVRFHEVPYLARALDVWRTADKRMGDFMAAAKELDEAIQQGSTQDMNVALEKIDSLNEKMTQLEVQFSEVLGEGSRWLEKLLMWIMLVTVLTVECSGLLLTVSFSRALNRNLKELGTAAQEFGKGNFSHLAPVNSNDELGQLAVSLNKMTLDLKRTIGEREEAEQASKVKSLFLANMSHEIRTPLGVIIGLTEILKDPQLSWEDRQRYIDTIERTGKNLSRIINDILDISKVEAGHLEIEKTQFSLEDFMSELHALLQVQAERNRNDIVFTALGVLPRYVFTDRTRLRQILVNVINNALKFTKNGKITLYYTADDHHLFFDVADTGMGISSEFKKDLFKNFSQADGSTTRIHEGTGLGLALSRRLSQALGGDVILLRSEIGVGSTFRLSIANNPADIKLGIDESNGIKPLELQQLGVKGKRVLVVEDIKENQLILKMYLCRYGMNVEFAENGKEAVDIALGGNYDVILMDMQMPVMDGYTATRVLRDRGYLGPIVALTAHAMKEDRDRCLQAGCDEYLTKPIEAATLYSTLTHVFQGSAAVETPQQSSS